jgi:hypothetical protein
MSNCYCLPGRAGGSPGGLAGYAQSGLLRDIYGVVLEANKAVTLSPVS